MGSFQTFWNGLDWSVFRDMLLRILPALICITLHELAHGLAAYRLGDPTAKRAGRLSLNPLRHIDWLGLAMMVGFGFGWAKPVPVDMRRFRNPKAGMALTAAAGPLCNLLLGVLFLFFYGLIYSALAHQGTDTAFAVLQSVSSAAYLSLALTVFNLIPIPPLDGSKVLACCFRDSFYTKYYVKFLRYERYGMILLLAVVASGVLGSPLAAAVSWLYDKLFVFAQWGYALTAAR